MASTSWRIVTLLGFCIDNNLTSSGTIIARRKMVKITIEQLAVMIQKEFSNFRKEMNERFEQVDSRFEQVDSRLDRIENRLDNVENKLDNLALEVFYIKKKISEIDERLIRVEKRSFEDSEVFAGEIIDIKKQIKILQAKVKKLETVKS